MAKTLQFPPNIIFLLENRNELNSLILLKYHGMLNLSELSQYLDRSKSNTMNYLEQLENLDLVQIVKKSDLPEEVLQKKGPKKYYQVSKEGKTIFHQIFPQLMQLPLVDAVENQLNLSKLEFAQQTIKEVQQHMQGQNNQKVNPIFLRSYMMARINSMMEEKAYFEYMSNIENLSKIIVDRLSDLVDDTKKNETLLNIIDTINPTMQINQLYHLPVHNIDDVKEIGKIVIDFLKNIEKYRLKKENENKNIEETNFNVFQHLYLFTGTLNESIFTSSNPRN